jgi:hypothetical protein
MQHLAVATAVVVEDLHKSQNRSDQPALCALGSRLRRVNEDTEAIAAAHPRATFPMHALRILWSFPRRPEMPRGGSR